MLSVKKEKNETLNAFREEWKEYKKNNSELQDIQRKAGSAKGLIHISEDFDQPLDDFKDYMWIMKIAILV